MISEVRDKVNDEYPQLDVEFVQMLQDQIGDLTNSPEPIEIKLFSPGSRIAEEVGAEEWATGIKKIAAVKDVKNGIENTISGSAIVMKVDPVVAARAGFTPQEIELDASAILQGEPATTPVVVNDRAYTIRVRFPESARASLEQIRNTLLIEFHGQDGDAGIAGRVSGRSGADGNSARESAAHDRGDGAVRGRESGQGDGRRCRRRWRTCICRRRSAWFTAGLMQEQQKSFQRSCWWCWCWRWCWCSRCCCSSSGSFAAPMAILASALLSTSGVFLALLVTRTTFNISSFMGLIMVIGIVAKNGILLLDADQRFRAEGAVGARGHDRGRGAAIAADPDDGAGDDGGDDSAFAGDWAPVRRCCSRWRLR